MESKLESVVCAGCTCLCDDLTVEVVNGDVVVSPACGLADSWFQRLDVEPTCKVDGKRVDFPSAIERAAELLDQARSPLVFGLDKLSTQSQIVAFEIARQTRAVIDTTQSDVNRASLLSMQTVGRITATLGEVSMRSDLIVFLFCDPVTTHPRFIERHCKSAKKIIVVSDFENETTKIADQFIRVERKAIGEFITHIRRVVAGEDAITPELGGLVETILSSSYGAFVVGALDANPVIGEHSQSLGRLTRSLNQRTRFVSLELRNDGNAQGAENVLAWSTGYPFAVSLSGGVPEYNGLEFSAARILANGECDVALVCSGRAFDRRLGAAHGGVGEGTSRVHQILITSEPGLQVVQPEVQFDVSFDEGDWCRLDDVSLPIKNVVASRNGKRRIARDVLIAIREQIGRIKGVRPL